MKTQLFISVIILLLPAACRQTERGQANGQGALPEKKKLPAAAPSWPPDSLYHIYITVDDGPSAGSEAINEIATRAEIKLTVFLVGRQAAAGSQRQRGYSLYKSNPLIEIGNHSFSHAHNRYKSFYGHPGLALQDFRENQDYLGLDRKLARMPGRNTWRLGDTSITDVGSSAAVADTLYREGYRIFGWDLEWRHNPRTGMPLQSVEEIYGNILLKLEHHKTLRRNQLVFLVHDRMFSHEAEQEEFAELVERLKKNGRFRFEKIGDYPAGHR